jgi:DNA replication and repair protein RecF
VTVKSLTLLNYRNYKNESFIFHYNFNLIIGQNGHGKTNLLEAINLICKFKPFKKTNLGEIINFGSEQTRLKGEILNKNKLNEINIQLLSSSKIIKVNNKILYKTAKYSNQNKLVTFLPQEIDLIKGPPANRRNYLDLMITNLDPEHLVDSKNYYKILKQRNALLAKPPKDSPGLLEVWNEKLSEPAGRITERRIKFINKISPIINKYYSKISGTKNLINIEYKSQFEISSNYKDDYISSLQRNLKKDILRKFTTTGPHRDQVIFNINGEDCSKFASQGESKSLVLSIKSAEIDLYRELSCEYPILILDDISSELDDKRKSYYSQLLNNYSGQIFVTTANLEPDLKRNANKIFHIESGRIVKVE